MGMEIKARDLIAAGWREEARLGAVLKRARELQGTGLDLCGVGGGLSEGGEAGGAAEGAAGV